MKSLKLNGIEVFTKGDIKNKAIVFIHGNSLNALTFKKQFEFIGDIPLVAINLPGHGNSENAKDPELTYCLPEYIKIIKDTIAHLELLNFILAGHSLGGHIAIEASEELDSLRGLFIFGTPPITMPPQMDKMFLQNPLMNLLFSGKMSEHDAKELAAGFVYGSSSAIKDLSQYIIETDPNARINLGGSIGKGLFKDEVEIIRKSTLLIALLHGKKDAFVNKEYIEQQKFQNLWKNKIIVLENSGHCPQLEEPIEFNRLVTEYHQSVFS